MIAAAHKERDQRAHPGRIKKRASTHVQYKDGGGFGAHRSDKVVDGFEAEFSIEADYEDLAILSGGAFQFELGYWHKAWRLAEIGVAFINIL